MKIVAKALLVSSDGSVLVLRRSATHPKFAHHPDFPGGEVEKSENIESAVTREIKEETGLDVTPSELQCVLKKETSSDLTHIIFTAKLNSNRPKVTPSWEHDTYRWMASKQLAQQPLPDNADGYYMDVIEYLGSQRVS